MEKIWYVQNESSGLHATKTDVQKTKSVATLCDIGFDATRATDRPPTPDEKFCPICADKLKEAQS